MYGLEQSSFYGSKRLILYPNDIINHSDYQVNIIYYYWRWWLEEI